MTRNRNPSFHSPSRRRRDLVSPCSIRRTIAGAFQRRQGPTKGVCVSGNAQRRCGVAPAGFTLPELLAVIAIIALLVAILLPALARVRHQARTLSCAARLSEVGAAIAMYANDWQGRCRSATTCTATMLRGIGLNRSPRTCGLPDRRPSPATITPGSSARAPNGTARSTPTSETTPRRRLLLGGNQGCMS